jgi:hypothetical protein
MFSPNGIYGGQKRLFRQAASFIVFTHQRSNDTTQIENHPEPGNETTLGSFVWVGHHNGTLSSPQQSSTDTQEGTSEDQESSIFGVRVAEETASVDAVSQSSETQGSLDTKLIDKSAGEKTHHGKGRVQGGIGLVGRLRVDLTSSTEPTEGIVHTRAQEADHGNHEQLYLGRSIPRDGDGTNLSFFVHPSRRPGDFFGLAFSRGGRVMDLGLIHRRRLLKSIRHGWRASQQQNRYGGLSRSE